MKDYSKMEHITPMKQQFIDARRVDNGVLISRRYRNSDEVLVITQGTKWVVPEKGFYCSEHGGWSLERCECNSENTRHLPDFNERVVAWSDATKALQHRCPTPGCAMGGTETGRICNKLPHTSSGNSRDFSKDTVTATKVLPELSWKGTLGIAPPMYNNCHACHPDSPLGLHTCGRND